MSATELRLLEESLDWQRLLQNSTFRSWEKTNYLIYRPSQLRRAAELKERIDKLMNELGETLGSSSGDSTEPVGKGEATGGRRMSAEGRRKIAEAARARWAKVRAAKGQTAKPVSALAPKEKKGRRKMSPEAKAEIAAAARARWAKIRAAKGK